MPALRVHAGLSGAAWVLAVATLAGANTTRAQQPELHYTLTGEEFADNLGRQVAALGDVDGDGSPDFAVSAPEGRVDENRLPVGGKVLVVSGRRGETLFTVRGEKGRPRYGRNLASGGDFDGDGVWDLLIQGSLFVDLVS
ncbi:MAG: integrin alpha, partial [Planctomycetota bacterium]|nr:integrin alpha [Planctomycetota bacterium]